MIQTTMTRVSHTSSEGTWTVHSIDIPDSENEPDFLVISDGSEERWHITHTESSLAQNHLVWTTGMLSQSGITTSTSFTSISTEHRVAYGILQWQFNARLFTIINKQFLSNANS